MPNGSTLPQHQLGRRLRRLRERAGLTLAVAAPLLDWSSSTLGRIETARQGVDVHGVRSMLDLYDIGGDEWTELIELARVARQKRWWHAYGVRDQGYLGLETDAATVHNCQLAYVPGLLQTADYMRALFHGSRRRPTEDDIDRDVQVRQRRLTEDPPLELVAIVDESALHRRIGGAEVMRAQLRQLVDRAALPSVCFQVLPIALGEPGRPRARRPPGRLAGIPRRSGPPTGAEVPGSGHQRLHDREFARSDAGERASIARNGDHAARQRTASRSSLVGNGSSRRTTPVIV